MYTIDKQQINKPYPLGVTTEHGYTYFSVVMKNGIDCGIILYDLTTGEEIRIPFEQSNKYGSIYSLCIKDLDIKKYAYNFYDGDKIFTDPYAKVIHGHSKWGKCNSFLKGGFISGNYSWDDEKPLKIPYENSILYCLNVRAFTKHKSSGVTHKGSFLGIIEKIPYLKELGITAIELMPSYEFDEMEKPLSIGIDYTAKLESPLVEEESKYNCWGYKEGYYFAPKASYGAGNDTVFELKNMIKKLHENGIEVIMQFYFPNSIKQGMILEIVKYWVLEYHIDGIHLKGERIPLHVIATEPLFSDTKLFYYDFPYEEIYEEAEKPSFRNLASYKDDYLNTTRRFLKGDDDMIGTFFELQRKNPSYYGNINYLTNYYGFSLWDLVSYEKKHNEANGENNRDGNDYNYSWNCGVEGPSRKKHILELRTKQIKNALTMLFLSQGTPLLYSGDEFGNTRYGNNNPYCQDNDIGFVKWNMSASGKIILEYAKSLIALKKQHPILHNPSEYKILDSIGCGYPDISYHGEEAWRPDLGNYSRFAGVMYCGSYADDNFFYIAYNMHWLPHTFALPNIPKGMKWQLIADTNETNSFTELQKQISTQEQTSAEVKARTIHIYMSKQEEGHERDKRPNYKKTAF